jgi:hypothetical protein
MSSHLLSAAVNELALCITYLAANMDVTCLACCLLLSHAEIQSGPLFSYIYIGGTRKMPGSLSSVDLVTSLLIFFSKNVLSTYFIKDEI